LVGSLRSSNSSKSARIRLRSWNGVVRHHRILFLLALAQIRIRKFPPICLEWAITGFGHPSGTLQFSFPLGLLYTGNPIGRTRSVRESRVLRSLRRIIAAVLFHVLSQRTEAAPKCQPRNTISSKEVGMKGIVWWPTMRKGQVERRKPKSGQSLSLRVSILKTIPASPASEIQPEAGATNGVRRIDPNTLLNNGVRFNHASRRSGAASCRADR
jgi:hypothetical protein